MEQKSPTFKELSADDGHNKWWDRWPESSPETDIIHKTNLLLTYLWVLSFG